MLSADDLQHARALRLLLAEGMLAECGDVDAGHGVRVPFALLVRITLAELEHLVDDKLDGGTATPRRWQLLATDLEHLHRLACAQRLA